jgi:beta-galactosidase
MKTKKNLLVLAGILLLSVLGVNAQSLYVGVNYHPHDDKNIEKIKSDIQLMKVAGFTSVRLGHLAWDSYEPSDGVFDFEWFESGDGPISYSETVRQRFIQWLKNKYNNLENLNKAWATQRWSRKINQFEEVGLPTDGQRNGAPEKILDFRRFVSDEVNQILFKVLDVVNKNAPNALTNTNAWYYSWMKYFDYSEIAYSGKMTREGCGFYPGTTLTTNFGVMNALFGISRIQFESANPFWCSEFTTMTAVPNAIRKQAYSTLFYGNQMVCGWTWQSMHAGEEQYLEGLIDWDGVPNRKYDEYKKIATEFKKIEKFFPYQLQAEVGLAFSFPSQIASASFPEQHDNQLQACYDMFYWRNMDARIVEISKSSLNYKILFVPGVAVMDEATATKIRDFVKNGGTVIMTSNSAIVDESGQVFASTRPGRLNDVFGIRVGSYEETEMQKT